MNVGAPESGAFEPPALMPLKGYIFSHNEISQSEPNMGKAELNSCRLWQKLIIAMRTTAKLKEGLINLE